MKKVKEFGLFLPSLLWSISSLFWTGFSFKCLLSFYGFFISSFQFYFFFSNICQYSKILVSPDPHTGEIKLLYSINVHYKISVRHNICSCEERICYVQFSNTKKNRHKSALSNTIKEACGRIGTSTPTQLQHSHKEKIILPLN